MPATSELPLDAPSLAIDPVDSLVVGALRRIAVGRADCPSLTRDLVLACGEDAREVMATLTVFLQVLAGGGPSRLNIGPPGRCVLTADERRLTALIASAQRGHDAVFEGLLDGLARREARASAALVVRAVATALCAHGLRLSSPDTACPANLRPA